MTAALVTATVVVVAAIVVVLVIYLVGIIVALAGAKRSLAKLAGGLVAIRDHTAPLGNRLDGINGGLTTLLQGLSAVNGDLAAIVRVAKGGK